jgi:hypothetical protein
MATFHSRQFVERLIASATAVSSAADARQLLHHLERQANECIARGGELQDAAHALGIRTPADVEAYTEGMAEEIDLLTRLQRAISTVRMQLPTLEARERRQRDVVLAVVQQFRSPDTAPVRYRHYLEPGLR